MATVELYSYARCSSCRKAEAVLTAGGVAFQRRDLFVDRLSAPEIRELLRRTGLTAGEVLSRRSAAYRELGLAEKLVTDDQLIELMSEYPALLRRPLVVTGEGTVVGFSQPGFERLIGQFGSASVAGDSRS